LPERIVAPVEDHVIVAISPAATRSIGLIPLTTALQESVSFG